MMTKIIITVFICLGLFNLLHAGLSAFGIMPVPELSHWEFAMYQFMQAAFFFMLAEAFWRDR